MAAAPKSKIRTTEKICRVVYTALKFSGNPRDPVQLVQAADYAPILRVDVKKFVICPVYHEEQSERSNLLWAAVARIVSFSYDHHGELSMQVEDSHELPFIVKVELLPDEADRDYTEEILKLPEILATPDDYRITKAVLFAAYASSGSLQSEPFSSKTAGTVPSSTDPVLHIYFLYCKNLISPEHLNSKDLTLHTLLDDETIQNEYGVLELIKSVHTTKKSQLKKAIVNSLKASDPPFMLEGAATKVIVGGSTFFFALPGTALRDNSTAPVISFPAYAEWFESEFITVKPLNLLTDVFFFRGNDLGMPGLVKVRRPINEPPYGFVALNHP